MAKFEKTVIASAAKVASVLKEGILDSGMSVELVDSASFDVGDTRVYLYVFDKYYMRNSSRASLTVQIVGDGTRARVTAIGAGGGNGSIFSFSWGAEENFIGTVEALLSEI